MPLLHRRLEGRELRLVQGALIGVDVHERPRAIDAEERRDPRLPLLVVRGVVLRVGHHPLPLEALDPGDGGLSGEERVLAVGLEGAPTERCAHQVHRRAEVAVEPTVLDLGTHHVAVAGCHRAVEVRSQRGARGHRGRPACARSQAAGAQRSVSPVDRRQVHVASGLAGEDPDLVRLRHRGQQELGASGRG